MSRTYRKYNKWYNNWWNPDSECDCPKSKARLGRDGHWWEDTQWYFKQVHRTGRAVNREQFAKLRRCEDYEYFTFDPTKHIKKHKRVWWEIY